MVIRELLFNGSRKFSLRLRELRTSATPTFRSDTKILPVASLDPVSKSLPNETAAIEPETTPGCERAGTPGLERESAAGMTADAPRSRRASTLIQVLRETVTALTLEPVLRGGPE